MNTELRSLDKESGLNSPELETVRFKFCLACAPRISHLLELDEAIAAYKSFESYLNSNTEKS
jgi:hypothetical protein